MRVHSGINTPVVLRLSSAIGCTALIIGMASHASAAKKLPFEVNLASESQALAFCQSGGMGTSDIDYIASPTGNLQFGPGFDCAQKKAKKSDSKIVTTALYLDSNTGTPAECTMTTAKSAVNFCNAGGIGEYDIDYIAGGPYKTVGGQGYGCDIVKHTNSIGNAICK